MAATAAAGVHAEPDGDRQGHGGVGLVGAAGQRRGATRSGCRPARRPHRPAHARQRRAGEGRSRRRPRRLLRRTGSAPRSEGSRRRRASRAGPAPTQHTSAAAPAPHTTSGSSALATTVVRRRARRSVRRQVAARWRTSLLRSSWSRLRLSSATARGAVASTTRPSQASSTSRARRRRGRAAGQGGRQPGREVGAEDVGGDRPGGGQGGPQQAGRRGLAVGSRHQGDASAGGQAAQGVGVDGQDGPAADHRAAAPPRRRDRPAAAPPIPAARRVRSGNGAGTGGKVLVGDTAATRLAWHPVKKRSQPTSQPTGTDIPALMLRLTIGPMLMVHGYNKVFGKGGLEGTTRWFDSLGLHPAHVHARLAAATEIGAGAMIAVGGGQPAAGGRGHRADDHGGPHRSQGQGLLHVQERVGVRGRGGSRLGGHGGARARDVLGRPPDRQAALGLASGRCWRPFSGVTNAALLLATSYHPAPPPEADRPSPTKRSSSPARRLGVRRPESARRILRRPAVTASRRTSTEASTAPAEE